ncbi:putative ABC transport system ATP-binding protein [Desulfocicer vacuolatum DSM 3385]|uniref:Putative ABC transport system ATP-binding protein n=1 Tax=Desulfocicer vacuolatum DSM 3385 TaxID=1121400 RepID=A0A1W2DXU1_9BACT|nr:ATP-binding cassette domain-containing protein [Desulfocicer vacuolatum]SMD02279.1 putative ABC transport system ATP-binding protein [Desulfocicer vacuolatum DSM 3385]
MISKKGDALHLGQLMHTRIQAGVRFQLIVPQMDLDSGQFAAVVGPSGCGKSTLLDILGLVLKPEKIGSFSIGGKKDPMDLTCLSQANQATVRSRDLGYVLQTGGLLPFLSVRQNIALPLRLNRQNDPIQVETMARILGIEGQLDKRPSFLSGGQRQRVAIARALVHKPRIVLADEPTAAVDELTAVEIRDQFRELSHKFGTTTIMVTHDRSLLRDQVDRVFGFKVVRKSQELTTSTLEELDRL